MTKQENTRKRLHALDGLRGICAISIMFYHYCMVGYDLHFFQIGTFGVYIFFILSGFSLWYVYSPQAFSATSFHNFYVARFARLFPLYFLIISIKFANPHIFQEPIRMASFMLNSTFLFGIVEPGNTSAIAGGWSIGIEWVFYLFFPLCLVFVHRLKTMFIILLFGIILNQVYTAAINSQNTIAEMWVQYSVFPVFIVYFIAGIICAEIYKNHANLSEKFKTISYQLLARAIVVSSIGFIFFYPSANTEQYLVGYHFPLLIIACMIAVLTCAFFVHPTAKETIIFKFLGDISLSTYLLHFFIYSQIQKRIIVPFYPDIPILWVLLSSAFISMTLGYIAYRFYEAPARKWIVNRYSIN